MTLNVHDDFIIILEFDLSFLSLSLYFLNTINTNYSTLQFIASSTL